MSRPAVEDAVLHESHRSVFVNFTNHPSAEWGQAQRTAARRYGHIVDLAFPQVPASAGPDAVAALAQHWAAQLLALDPACVLCQGEMTLCFLVVQHLLAQGVPVVAACSERRAEQWTDDGGIVHRRAVFEFVGFRPFRLL